MEYVTEEKLHGQDKCSVISPKYPFSPQQIAVQRFLEPEALSWYLHILRGFVPLLFWTHVNFQHSENSACCVINYCFLSVLNWPPADLICHPLLLVLEEKKVNELFPVSASPLYFLSATSFITWRIFLCTIDCAEVSGPPFHPPMYVFQLYPETYLNIEKREPGIGTAFWIVLICFHNIPSILLAF